MYSTSVAASGSGDTHVAIVSGREELRCPARRVLAVALGRGAATQPQRRAWRIAPCGLPSWRRADEKAPVRRQGAETMVEKGLPPQPRGWGSRGRFRASNLGALAAGGDFFALALKFDFEGTSRGLAREALRHFLSGFPWCYHVDLESSRLQGPHLMWTCYLWVLYSSFRISNSCMR